MFDYGNSLGNAWILKTMYMRHIEEMDKEFKNFKPDSVQKSGLFKKQTPPPIPSWTGLTSVNQPALYVTA